MDRWTKDELIVLMLLNRTARERGEPADWRKMIVDHNRLPPLPYWSASASCGDNVCPICLQPTFRGGSWKAAAGMPRRSNRWHIECLGIYNVWRSATTDAVGKYLLARQGGLCAASGLPLLPNFEVDHKIPLWRVKREIAGFQWPEVLRMWGPGNLQALNKSAHAEKTKIEATERAQGRADGMVADRKPDAGPSQHPPA